MDAREGDGGPARAVSTPGRPDAGRPADRSEAGGPARPRPSGASTDESRERDDAETYAVLGED
ncbi:hypothetical protein ACFYUY_22615 [Kitasatospora sp. NPDC004745]|uniref:hypothetical protein n=1 Tax=unclassified Kitasatospora TaxID=2633591 RepID=UPI0033CFE3CB